VGLMLGFSLIMVIGSQNIYVIKQGILRQYAFSCALVCGLCNAILRKKHIWRALEFLRKESRVKCNEISKKQ